MKLTILIFDQSVRYLTTPLAKLIAGSVTLSADLSIKGVSF